MEELKKVSPEDKKAFKNHYHQMHRAFERFKVNKTIKKQVNTNRITLDPTSKSQF